MLFQDRRKAPIFYLGRTNFQPPYNGLLDCSVLADAFVFCYVVSIFSFLCLSTFEFIFQKQLNIGIVLQTQGWHESHISAFLMFFLTGIHTSYCEFSGSEFR